MNGGGGRIVVDLTAKNPNKRATKTKGEGERKKPRMGRRGGVHKGRGWRGGESRNYTYPFKLTLHLQFPSNFKK